MEQNLKYAKEIAAYAQGKEIECLCVGWQEWMNLKEMRDSAIRTFLGIDNDKDWQFRIKQNS